MSNISEQDKELFLLELTHFANQTRAARVARVSLAKLRELRANDDDFRNQWDEALEVGLQACKDAARERAFEGLDKPVFQGGAEVGHVKVYSDSLAKTFLEADFPETFGRAKEIHLTGVEQTLRDSSTRELRDELEKLMRKLGVDHAAISTVLPEDKPTDK